MNTAVTDALWLNDEGLQLWLVIPDDVDPAADRNTLDLEQLDGGWTTATEQESTTLDAVEESLASSGWQLGTPWRDTSPSRATAAVTRSHP